MSSSARSSKCRPRSGTAGDVPSGRSRLALAALAIAASALPLLSGCAEDEYEGRAAAYPQAIGYTPPPTEARSAVAPAPVASPAAAENGEPEEALPPGDSGEVVVGADDHLARVARRKRLFGLAVLCGGGRGHGRWRDRGSGFGRRRRVPDGLRIGCGATFVLVLGTPAEERKSRRGDGKSRERESRATRRHVSGCAGAWSTLGRASR